MARRRRRRSPVPFMEWLHAFSIAQKLVAEAYDKLAEQPGPWASLFGFGAVFRIALNKVLLPRLRNALAANPGVETPEQIREILVKALEEVKPEELRSAIASLGVKPEELDKYVDAAAEMLTKIKEYLAAKAAAPAAAATA